MESAYKVYGNIPIKSKYLEDAQTRLESAEKLTE